MTTSPSAMAFIDAKFLKRDGNEGMVQYVSRKKTLFNELSRAKCDLPDLAKGYIMLRDARLPDRAWDMVDGWTYGSYKLADVSNALRKLERPIPGKTKTHIAGIHY